MPSGKRAELLLPSNQVHHCGTHCGPHLSSSHGARDSRCKEGNRPPHAAQVFLHLLVGTTPSSLQFRAVVSPFLSRHGSAHCLGKKQPYQLSVPFPPRCRLFTQAALPEPSQPWQARGEPLLPAELSCVLGVREGTLGRSSVLTVGSTLLSMLIRAILHWKCTQLPRAVSISLIINKS